MDTFTDPSNAKQKWRTKLATHSRCHGSHLCLPAVLAAVGFGKTSTAGLYVRLTSRWPIQIHVAETAKGYVNEDFTSRFKDV